MENICKKIISEHPSLKRIAGIVTNVTQGSVSATVSILGSTASISLLNKTCQILEVGDHVWVYYWKSVTDGYIAIKNVDGEYKGGAGDIIIDNAFVLREGSHEYITTHSYSETHSYDTLHNFIKPSSGAVGAITSVDYFPNLCAYLDNRFPNESHALHVQQSYLYEETLSISGGQYVVNIWNGSRSGLGLDTAGNNYHMYQTLSIQSYVSTYPIGGYVLETKNMYFDVEEPSEGLYHITLVIAASEHEAEKRYHIYATPGTAYPDINNYKIVLRPINISLESLYSSDYLTVTLDIRVFEYRDDYNVWWERDVSTGYNLRTPLDSTKVDTHIHTGNMVDVKERSVVV